MCIARIKEEARDRGYDIKKIGLKLKKSIGMLKD